jgi:hypothetical protein
MTTNGDGDVSVTESVENRQKTFSGNTEDLHDPVDYKLIDENFCDGATSDRFVHGIPFFNPLRWIRQWHRRRSKRGLQ